MSPEQPALPPATLSPGPLSPPTQTVSPDLEQAWMEILSLPELQVKNDLRWYLSEQFAQRMYQWQDPTFRGQMHFCSSNEGAGGAGAPGEFLWSAVHHWGILGWGFKGVSQLSEGKDILFSVGAVPNVFAETQEFANSGFAGAPLSALCQGCSYLHWLMGGAVRHSLLWPHTLRQRGQGDNPRYVASHQAGFQYLLWQTADRT